MLALQIWVQILPVLVSECFHLLFPLDGLPFLLPFPGSLRIPCLGLSLKVLGPRVSWLEEAGHIMGSHRCPWCPLTHPSAKYNPMP